MNRRPIGVFDSGIGGLTVIRELIHQLPHESLIYFGDTARVPYGNKSPETVRRYSREILAFLLARDVKMVVVACNTASAHALDDLQRLAPVPVEGVVEPGARAALRHSRSRRIGVIGTAGTMRSGVYERAIRALDPAARVTQKACPLFVPMVEEGWLDHPATKLIAHEYLDPLKQDDGHSTLHAPSTAHGRVTFVVSDAPEQFERVGAAFLGERVRDVETVPLGERH